MSKEEPNSFTNGLRIPDWRDNRTLFESALAVRPSALAHLNLGNLALAETGFDVRQRGRVEQLFPVPAVRRLAGSVLGKGVR